MKGKIESIVSQGFRYMLFFSSYLPLFVITFFINIENTHLSLSLIAIVTITLLTLKWYIAIPLQALPNDKIKISAIKNNGSDVLNYIVTYIIPFISFNGSVFDVSGKINFPSLIAFIILFLVIGNLYMYNNLYHINPVLTIFYDIFTATDSYEKDIVIISNKNMNIPMNETIFTRNISPGIKLYTKDTKSIISYKKISVFIALLIASLFIWNTESQLFIKDFITSIIKTNG